MLPKLRLGLGLNWRGEQNPEGSRHVTADSFVTADAMAEYTFSDRWLAKLNVTNRAALITIALRRGNIHILYMGLGVFLKKRTVARF